MKFLKLKLENFPKCFEFVKYLNFSGTERFGSRFQHYLAVKNEIFSSADRAFYKNAQIYTPVRANAFFRN